MANLQTGAEILVYVLRRAGELLPTTTSPSFADHLIDTQTFINTCYWDLCSLKPWRWARTRTQVASVAKVTGSVTTVAGATITMSATVATSLTGRKFMIDTDGIPHRILAHTAGTDTLTLVTSYTGTATSGGFTVFQDEITVASDILAFPTIQQLNYTEPLIVVSESELDANSPKNIFGLDQVQYAAFLTESKIKIVPWTSTAKLFNLSYNYRPPALDFSGTATDIPIVPAESREAIALLALIKLGTDKRDARNQNIAVELQQKVDKLSANETSFAKYRLVPAARATLGYVR